MFLLVIDIVSISAGGKNEKFYETKLNWNAKSNQEKCGFPKLFDSEHTESF
jgi:hypothetical protein